MALGNYNNNDDKKKNSPTIYSAYRMYNQESTVDPTTLGFSYWNNLLCISITPKKENSNADYTEWDKDNAVKIYLNHTKARILETEIELFLKGEDSDITNNGVDAGAGLVSICKGKEFGIERPCLCIRRISTETGAVESSAVYEFRNNQYSIRNYNQKNNTFAKVMYEKAELEIQELLTVLKEYYIHMSGGAAYSIIDNMKYDNSRTQTKLELVMDKLGIPTLKGSKNRSNGSFFSNGNNTSGGNSINNYQQSTTEDIESMLAE